MSTLCLGRTQDIPSLFMSRWMLITLNLDVVVLVLDDVDHDEPGWCSSSNWEPQADALYHLGDFEHALVYYHRGLRYQVQSNTYVRSFIAPAVSWVILNLLPEWQTKNSSISVILAVVHYPSLYGFPVCADYFRIFADFPPKTPKYSDLASGGQRRLSPMLLDQKWNMRLYKDREFLPAQVITYFDTMSEVVKAIPQRVLAQPPHVIRFSCLLTVSCQNNNVDSCGIIRKRNYLFCSVLSLRRRSSWCQLRRARQGCLHKNVCSWSDFLKTTAHQTWELSVFTKGPRATWDLKGSRTDLEANRNDRKRAESQKPLWHRGITLQEMLQILLAPEKGIVFIWLHMSLDCTVTPRGPREQTLWPKFSILGVFCHLRLKGAIPHPFTIQNEVWEIKDFLW